MFRWSDFVVISEKDPAIQLRSVALKRVARRLYESSACITSTFGTLNFQRPSIKEAGAAEHLAYHKLLTFINIVSVCLRDTLFCLMFGGGGIRENKRIDKQSVREGTEKQGNEVRQERKEGREEVGARKKTEKKERDSEGENGK